MSGERQQPAGRSRPTWWLWGLAGVVAGGPAEKAGLQAGDVITTVDGKQATSNIQLQEVTLTKNPGETVELGYLRNGKAEKTTVTLGAQP